MLPFINGWPTDDAILENSQWHIIEYLELLNRSIIALL